MVRRFIKKHGWLKVWIIVIVSTLIVTVGGVWGLRTWYYHNLEPVSQSEQITYFTVEKGDNLSLIAANLKKAGLIRSTRAMETYVRSNALHDQLQAGTYAITPSLSTQEIVTKLTGGEVAKNLLTILPGKRLDQIKEAFSKAGYSQAEIEKAFSPSTYAGHPALANLPPGASLEGYLYPDSFQQQADTPAETIVRQSLDEMQKYMTSDTIAAFNLQGLSPHEAVILASIVLKETGSSDYSPTVAQVFLSRLKQDMPLQADPTAFYASALAGQEPSLSIESPYNTYLHAGLPPGPISNVNKLSLQSVAYPASSTYLYFVAGDDGKVHFSHTQAEHEAAVEKYCTTACGR